MFILTTHDTEKKGVRSFAAGYFKLLREEAHPSFFFFFFLDLY